MPYHLCSLAIPSMIIAERMNKSGSRMNKRSCIDQAIAVKKTAEGKGERFTQAETLREKRLNRKPGEAGVCVRHSHGSNSLVCRVIRLRRPENSPVDRFH